MRHLCSGTSWTSSLFSLSGSQLAQLRGQSDRNIHKVHNTIRKKLQKELPVQLCQIQKKGKDTVIRRANKTKQRKKKAALDGIKDSE